MNRGQDILAAGGTAVPRYTSYPTAPHFKQGEGAGIAADMLSRIGDGDPVSIYMHIPFCDRLCWFCACHTKHTNRYAPIAEYVKTLTQEIALVGSATGGRAQCGFLHLGGGSPSLLREEDAARLSDALRGSFDFADDAEISIEIDPSDLKDNSLAGLEALGITRASIGVQDFDEDVQQAINRPQSHADTADIVSRLRDMGIASVNIDAVYGLPRQTLERLERTIDNVCAMRPDRVALFGYAHVPWMKPHQKMIRDEDLPDGRTRLKQAEAAERRLIAAGYVKIGIDHFALPDDSLAVAARQGRLRRNFQGYTTDAAPTLIGLGASSISQYEGGYVQNIVPTGQYAAAVKDGRLPGDRGYLLTLDDRIRAYMIERLMCDFEIDFDAMREKFGLAARPHIALAHRVAAADRHDLCAADEWTFRMAEDVRPLVRIVASRFDAYLDNGGARYSKAV